MTRLEIRRVPVTADVVTVLGCKWEADSAAWSGLDFANAEPRVQASGMIVLVGADSPTDVHLSVPFCHPDDRTGSPEDFDSFYRVRPRMEAGKKWKGEIVKWVAFERWDGDWVIAYAVEAKAKKGAT